MHKKLVLLLSLVQSIALYGASDHSVVARYDLAVTVPTTKNSKKNYDDIHGIVAKECLRKCKEATRKLDHIKAMFRSPENRLPENVARVLYDEWKLNSDDESQVTSSENTVSPVASSSGASPVSGTSSSPIAIAQTVVSQQPSSYFYDTPCGSNSSVFLGSSWPCKGHDKHNLYMRDCLPIYYFDCP